MAGVAGLLRGRRSSLFAAVKLADLGPRLVSNQTSQPLALYGDGFAPGMTLRLGPPFSREVPLAVLDPRHAYARLPDDLQLPADTVQTVVDVAVGRSESKRLTVVNDAAFVDLTALAPSPDGRLLFAASAPTDTVFAIELEHHKVTPLRAGDGPSALAGWKDSAGNAWMVVAHAFAPELRLLRAGGSGEPRTIPAVAYATGLAIDQERGIAFVAEHALDTVVAISLAEGGRVLWRTPVRPNPRAISLAGNALAVGSLQTGEVELLSRETGEVLSRAAPRPETEIIGGRTEKYARYVMGGKAPRGMAYSRQLGALFVSSVGPNIGPNPDRMEVSMNGGVSQVAVTPSARFVRHLGFGGGVTEGICVDDEAGLLYAADVGIGRVRVVDAKALVGSAQAARSAVLQEIAIPPMAGFPLVRPAGDFGVSGRAGVELHSGPLALVLGPDRGTLYVLNRFTRTLAVVDVRGASQGRAALVEQLPIAPGLEQQSRRLGQVLYHADMGRSGMSCDTCHLNGHTEGVLFEKTRPMRIYRSTTIRASRETPPYFTPASTRSLAETMEEVGSRNRFHNPSLTPQEIEAVTVFSAAVTLLPNPFAGKDGAPVERLALPDDARRDAAGNPRRGLALFEGKAGCAQCHPPPHFTLDQAPETRGKYLDVGTPGLLPMRTGMQDLYPGPFFGTPSLLGAWDIFPMLGTGAAGFAVSADDQLVVETRVPARLAIERYGAKHGNAAQLTPEERDDLLAYVLSL